MIIDEEIGATDVPAMRTAAGPACPPGDWMQVGFGTTNPRCVALPPRNGGQGAERMSKLAESLENIPPAASMVVPGAITFLVDRKKHPIIWTVFGVIPLGFAAVRAIAKGRLF